METKSKLPIFSIVVGIVLAIIILFAIATYYSYTDSAVQQDREVLSSVAKEERTQIMKDLGLDEKTLLVDATSIKDSDSDSDSDSKGIIISKDSTKENRLQTNASTSTNGKYKEADMNKVTAAKQTNNSTKKEVSIKDSGELAVPTQKELADFQKTNEYQSIFDKRKDIISIPSVNTYLPLYNQLDNPHLNVGVSTYDGEFDATKTNNIILGHNIEVEDKLFSNLPSVQKGEKIFIYKDKLKYTYYVTSIEVVEYDKSTALTKKYEYGNQLTLITCYGASKDKNKRIVVHASAEIEN